VSPIRYAPSTVVTYSFCIERLNTSSHAEAGLHKVILDRPSVLRAPFLREAATNRQVDFLTIAAELRRRGRPVAGLLEVPSLLTFATLKFAVSGPPANALAKSSDFETCVFARVELEAVTADELEDLLYLDDRRVRAWVRIACPEWAELLDLPCNVLFVACC